MSTKGIKSYSAETLLRSGALSLVSRALAARGPIQLPRSLSKISQRRPFFVRSSPARHKRQHSTSVLRELPKYPGFHRLVSPSQPGPESGQRALLLGVIAVFRAQVGVVADDVGSGKSDDLSQACDAVAHGKREGRRAVSGIVKDCFDRFA